MELAWAWESCIIMYVQADGIEVVWTAPGAWESMDRWLGKDEDEDEYVLLSVCGGPAGYRIRLGVGF